MSGSTPAEQPHDPQPAEAPPSPQPQQQQIQPSQPPAQPQYAQPQYVQQGYVQPVYYGQPLYLAPPPPPRGKSITSMVLGLVSVFFGFVLFLPLIGFIFGLTALKSEPAGRGMAITGLILNGLMLLGWVVAVVFIVLAFVGLGAATYSTGIST